MEEPFTPDTMGPVRKSHKNGGRNTSPSVTGDFTSGIVFRPDTRHPTHTYRSLLVSRVRAPSFLFFVP